MLKLTRNSLKSNNMSCGDYGTSPSNVHIKEEPKCEENEDAAPRTQARGDTWLELELGSQVERLEHVKKEPCSEENDEAALRTKAEPERSDTRPTLEVESDTCLKLVKQEPVSWGLSVQLLEQKLAGGAAAGYRGTQHTGQGAKDMHLIYEGHRMKEEELVWQRSALLQQSKENTKALEPTLHQHCIHSNKLLSFDNCHKTSASKNKSCKKITEKNITPKQAVTCNTCGKKYTHKDALLRHQQTHTEDKPFICDVCEKKFAQKKILNIHLRIHSGERPFTCDICNRKFAQKSNLTNHQRTHTGERPFTCNICSKMFTQRSNLTTHLRVHSGEKPFPCNMCDKSFTVKGNLASHIRNNHMRR